MARKLWKGGKRQRIRKAVGEGYVYAIREANGRFVDIQNIGRATQQDKKRKAINKAKSGKKYRGD
jgi:hypothetical protein